jgi:hypothetical protein
MNELEETIVYDALMCILDNAKTLCDFVNASGTASEKKAYRNGIYSAAIKLQVALGTDGMDRGNVRYNEMKKRIAEYVASNATITGAVPASGASPCWADQK